MQEAFAFSYIILHSNASIHPDCKKTSLVFFPNVTALGSDVYLLSDHSSLSSKEC